MNVHIAKPQELRNFILAQAQLRLSGAMSYPNWDILDNLRLEELIKHDKSEDDNCQMYLGSIELVVREADDLPQVIAHIDVSNISDDQYMSRLVTILVDSSSTDATIIS